MGEDQPKLCLLRALGQEITPKTKLFSLLALIALFATVSLTHGYELSEVPDFADREKWIFVEEGPLIYPTPWANYEIGRIKKYRRANDERWVGFEEFIIGNEKPYWKRWGVVYSQLTYHALGKKDSGGWTVGPPGSYWQAIGVFEGTDMKGVWFLLFIPPQGECFGRYFPIPTYRLKETVRPEKSEASPIRFYE